MTDYIKREDALKRRHGCDSDCKTCDFFTDGDSWCNGDVFVLDLLSIPAADVVEQKHGKWVTDEDGCLCCSLCGNPCEINCINGKFIQSPYCSECGALMRGNEDVSRFDC